MKFTRSNFKEAQRRAKNLLDAYWQQRQENAELTRKYNDLVKHYLEQMEQYAKFIRLTAEEKLPEIDLLIERQRSDEQYLSRQMLETRFKLTNHRGN